ncbi:MAG: NfeD family protein [Pirellulales bacterium]|nr:NfeD family protein [Pirellulales bacterium]
MSEPFLWATILLALGLFLVGLEFLLPSSGIIGLSAALCLGSGIGMAFYYGGSWYGYLYLAIALLCVPVIVGVGFKLLPYTPLGKKLLSLAPMGDEVLSDVATRRNLRGLIGMVGRAITPILPSGSIEVAGLVLDAISQGMPIEKGAGVQIIDIQGTRIIVRPFEGPIPSGVSAPVERENIPPDTQLFEQSLESLGIELEDDPPTKPA